MTAPLFSIVIPTFNRSDLVTFAIHSILRQTFQDFEIVVSDNHSTDDTSTVVSQIADPRLTYLRTPSHLHMADNWEFGRANAKGSLIMMLADDDALVATGLERFAHAFRHHGAEFLFCGVAEYRDRTFLGPGANTLLFPPFSGSIRVISSRDFLQSLYSFRPSFRMDPSAFVFHRRIADLVAKRCGRFFKTNGVEFFAWPLAAALATRTVFLDAPLSITGRTAKSWGTNVVLGNPGRKRIAEYIADVDPERHCAPLSNFTYCNLMAEGMLMAKRFFPEELNRYDFDEQEYLRKTRAELKLREGLGVDVTEEMDELETYAARYPPPKEAVSTPWSAATRANTEQGTWARLRWDASYWFTALGDASGFRDILGCAAFLASLTSARGNPERAEAMAGFASEALSKGFEAIHSDDLPTAKAYLTCSRALSPRVIGSAEYWRLALRLAAGRSGVRVGRALKRRIS